MKELDFLTILGLEYHYNTETFDRIDEHGIGPSGKTAMPVNRGASSANAYQAKDELMQKAIDKGFTVQEAIKAIRNTAQYDYEEICEILNKYCFPL